MKTALSTSPEPIVMTEAVDLAGLFRAHARYVAGVAMRLLGNDADVDDVVQEVFLAAGSGLRSLREPAAVRGWLATVAVRIAIRKLRWRKLRQWVPFADLKAEPLFTHDLPADERVLLTAIYAELELLPVAVRIAWSLRFLEGQQLEEVARLCDCSLATAKRRIAAAQARLEEVFGG